MSIMYVCMVYKCVDISIGVRAYDSIVWHGQEAGRSESEKVRSLILCIVLHILVGGERGPFLG